VLQQTVKLQGKRWKQESWSRKGFSWLFAYEYSMSRLLAS